MTAENLQEKPFNDFTATWEERTGTCATAAAGCGSLLDLLRAFVEVCEVKYAEDYHGAAGVRPDPIDPQQVVELMDEQLDWRGLSKVYRDARGYLDGVRPASAGKTC